MVRYLYIWDSDISDRVYGIKVRICDNMYFILFCLGGSACGLGRYPHCV